METYIPLISGLIGAIIGALASIMTIIVQSRAQNKRERTRMAAQLAIEDYKMSIEMAVKSGLRVSVTPPTAYLHYHMKLMDLLEKGSLDPDTLRQITEENKKIIDEIKILNKEREAQKKANQP
jgi:hypothetical protein